MDHRLGQIDLIAWQGRRQIRRTRPVGGWTVLLFFVALAGLSGAGAQAMGWISLPPVLAGAPAALVLLAAGIQVVALLRGVAAWIAG
jgi:hypothetical protein